MDNDERVRDAREIGHAPTLILAFGYNYVHSSPRSEIIRQPTRN